MEANIKYKLIGFDILNGKANVMVLNTGRVMSMPYERLLSSEVIDDFNAREVSAVCRKIYSSGESVKTEYEFKDRNEKQWLTYVAFVWLLVFVIYLVI